MVNEARVKELFKIAVFDQNSEKHYRQMEEYYRRDYLGKEMLKSFFSGTIAFAMLAGIYLVYGMEEFLNSLATLDYIEAATTVAMAYAIFMVIYMGITYIVYQIRYSRGRKKLKTYFGHIKRVNGMYDREEKLK